MQSMQQISSGVLSGGQYVSRPAVAPRSSPAPIFKLSSSSTSTLHRSPLQKCNAGFSSGPTGSPDKKADSKKSDKKKPRITRYLDVEDGSAQQSAEEFSGWFEVPDVDAIQSFVSKPIKPIILATGKAICLYKVGEQIFCTDANSTAYQYPLADANILGLKTGPAVEVKLDGSVYDLATGKVMSWCPNNNPVRGFLGALKNKTEPIDLPVYPTKVEGSRVFVKLSRD